MDTEYSQPSYSLRTMAIRPAGETYEDLSLLMKNTFNFYSRIEKIISPFNARQIASSLPYSSPSRQYLADIIGQRNARALPELTVNNMLASTIRFCEKWKGKKQLPMPHSSTFHSIHLCESQFKIAKVDDLEWNKNSGVKKQCKNVFSISIEGTKDIYVEDFKPQYYRFLIVRQRLSKTGVPSNNLWEVLFFKHNYGFIIDWVDADLNPRWAGIV